MDLKFRVSRYVRIYYKPCPCCTLYRCSVFYSVNSWPSVDRRLQRAQSPDLGISHQECGIMFGILLINPEQHFNYENLQVKKRQKTYPVWSLSISCSFSCSLWICIINYLFKWLHRYRITQLQPSCTSSFYRGRVTQYLVLWL